MPPLDLVAMALGMFIGLLMGALLCMAPQPLARLVGRCGANGRDPLASLPGVYIATQRKRDMLDAWKAERTTAAPYSVDFSAASRAQRMEALGGPTNQLSSDMSILSGMNGQLGMGLTGPARRAGRTGGRTEIPVSNWTSTSWWTPAPSLTGGSPT